MKKKARRILGYMFSVRQKDERFGNNNDDCRRAIAGATKEDKLRLPAYSPTIYPYSSVLLHVFHSAALHTS